MHFCKRAARTPLLAGAVLLTACGPTSGPDADGGARTADELRAASAAFAGETVAELVGNSAAMDLAAKLYAADCAACHGADARGQRAVPGLRSSSFAYGADAESVRTTISQGRRSVMPAMGRELGEVELGQVVAFVQSLGSGAALGDYERRGKQLYDSHCTECHGPEGLGIREQGTPNIADDTWRHGGTMMNIRLVITGGAESECPAQQDELSATQIDLLTAFVLRMRAQGSSQGSDTDFN